MKINLLLKRLLPCVAGAAIISTSYVLAADVTVNAGETYTAPGGNSTSANQDNLTVNGGTITFAHSPADPGHLEGNIELNNGSTLEVGTGNTGVLWTNNDINTFNVSGDIYKTGDGTLRIDRTIISDGESTLNIQGGTVDFGDNTNDNAPLGFTHVRVGAGATFNWTHSGIEVGSFSLEGGTFKHSGQNSVATTISELSVTADSNFEVQATGTYNISKLTNANASNLNFTGSDVQLNFNVNTIENFAGSISATSLYHDISIKNINQSAGKTVTITDADGIEASEGLIMQGGGTAYIYSDLSVSGGELKVSEGSLVLGGATTSASNVVGSNGGRISLNTSNSRLSIDGGIYSLSATASSLSAAGGSISGTSYELSSNTIEGATLTSINITVNDAEQLTLRNVILDSSTSITLGAGSTFGIEDAQLTGLSVSDIGTTEGVFETGVQTYSISGISDILQGQANKGTLTLNLDILGNFEDPSISGKIFAFNIDDALIDSVSDLVESGWYGDIELIINGNTYSVLGVTEGINTGNIMFYIPEPSTATLSLLALAGLLARRRRKA